MKIRESNVEDVVYFKCVEIEVLLMDNLENKDNKRIKELENKERTSQQKKRNKKNMEKTEEDKLDTINLKKLLKKSKSKKIVNEKKASKSRYDREDDCKMIVLRGLAQIPMEIRNQRYSEYDQRVKPHKNKSDQMFNQDIDCFENAFIPYFRNIESKEFTEHLFDGYLSCSNIK